MTTKRILITGATGLIGSALTDRFESGDNVVLTARSKDFHSALPYHSFDLSQLDEIPGFLDRLQPDVIVHTAAIGSVDQAEMHQEDALRLNVQAVESIASWCRINKARMIHFSSDFVFDGTRLDWKETDEVAPLSWYGKTKVMSEQKVQSLLEDHVIIRPILVYGTAAQARRLNLPLLVLAKLSAQQGMRITKDQVRMPTYVDDVAWAVHQLLNHPFKGRLHLSGPETIDVHAFSLLTADVFGLDDELLEPIQTNQAHQTGQRPMKSGFDLSLAQSTIGYRPTAPRDALVKMRETLMD